MVIGEKAIIHGEGKTGKMAMVVDRVDGAIVRQATRLTLTRQHLHHPLFPFGPFTGGYRNEMDKENDI